MKFKDVFSVIVGFSGIGLISFGAYQLLPAAGFIVFGVSLVAFSYLISRSGG